MTPFYAPRRFKSGKLATKTNGLSSVSRMFLCKQLSVLFASQTLPKDFKMVNLKPKVDGSVGLHHSVRNLREYLRKSIFASFVKKSTVRIA